MALPLPTFPADDDCQQEWIHPPPVKAKQQRRSILRHTLCGIIKGVVLPTAMFTIGLMEEMFNECIIFNADNKTGFEINFRNVVALFEIERLLLEIVNGAKIPSADVDFVMKCFRIHVNFKFNEALAQKLKEYENMAAGMGHICTICNRPKFQAEELISDAHFAFTCDHLKRFHFYCLLKNAKIFIPLGDQLIFRCETWTKKLPKTEKCPSLDIKCPVCYCVFKLAFPVENF